MIRSEECRYLFTLVDSLVKELEAITYVWGGWVAYIYSGSIFRKHDYTDCLVLNLYKISEKHHAIFNTN